MSFKILKHRRGTTQEWLDINLIPEEGELVIEECIDGTCKCKIGNGKTHFSYLPYLGDDLQAKLLAEVEALDETFSTKLVETESKVTAQTNAVENTLRDIIKDTARSLTLDFTEADNALSTNLAIDIAQNKLSIQATQNKLLETKTEVLKQLDLAKTDLSNSLSEEVNKLEASVEGAVVDITADIDNKIQDTSNDFNNAIEKETSARKVAISGLKQNLDNLESTVDTKLQTQAEHLDNKLTLKAQELTNTFTADIQDAVETFKNDNGSINDRLDTEVTALNKSIEATSKNLIDTFNTSLATNTKLMEDFVNTETSALTEKLTSAKKDTEEAIEQTKEGLNNNLTQAYEELKKADNDLTNTINSLRQQGFNFSAEIASKLKTLYTNIDALNKLDKDLTSKLNATADSVEVLTEETQQIKDSVTLVEHERANDFEYINSELNSLDNTHKLLNITSYNTLLEHIRKIYVEIEDLIDDDVSIIKRVFSLNNELEYKLSELDSRSANSLNTAISELRTDVDKLHQEVSDELETTVRLLTETVTVVTDDLRENIEALRSSSNLRIIDNKQAIETLSIAVQDTKSTTETRLNELTKKVKYNKDDIDYVFDVVSNRLIDTNIRIDETNDKIAQQARRISNVISLSHGSTTGDAELMDIRTGYNGVDHASAGDAVRAIGNDLEDLKNSLPDYIPSSTVDGLDYDTATNELYLTSKNERIGDPVVIVSGSGGAGGSISVVKVQNNLATNTFAVAKGNLAKIKFTYTSFENEIPTGDGTFITIINNKRIDDLSGIVIHGVPKELDLTSYLKNGSNDIKVTCTDQYGASRSLVYTISIIELRIESTFDSNKIFTDDFQFRYKLYGQVEKTAHILIDDVEISTKNFSASISGNENTLSIAKQPHGCHKIKAYLSANLGNDEIKSNILEYEIICIEDDHNEALLATVTDVTEVTQGDLVTIPFLIYDPDELTCRVELSIHSKAGGELTEFKTDTVIVDRSRQLWQTRSYPTHEVVFRISYIYDLYGVETTLVKEHTIIVNPSKVELVPETDSLQLYLTAAGRSNNKDNLDVWTYQQESDGNKEYDLITTSFSNFNWKTNGWCVDANGDTCLRLNGDARAVINFKPFDTDFKLNGKTIEFEFVVRDVNNRTATVIDCFDGHRGFRATPDTAFLASSGTEVSCRYKDEEHVHVVITVEPSSTTSQFVSIYLDGILSGVQRYATTDNFEQEVPLSISLGSNLCGLDLYSVRIYDKALSTSQVLTNYIATKADPTTKRQLLADNDIFNENGDISYERIKALGNIPIITFTGKMPTYKGDKKKNSVQMKFEDPVHPELNFDVLLDQIDVQGTSSQFYIRKNWKVKLPEARSHMPGAIPAKVFCIKVDYAEATGTHNTGSANYIETLYDRSQAIIPPQKDDTRVRTTVQGFPVVLFEKETEDSEPVFASKGNFNYDKDAENTFGFTEAYKAFGVECWEFCNNTSDSVNFAGEIQPEWLEDFEPRYVPESAGFERIEELQELADLAASGKGVITEAQKTELATLMRNCISNFKEMHDWVLSTATYTLDSGKKVPIIATPLETPITYGETTYTEDNDEYRLAKFKYEFENYFNLHYASLYYVFTFFALMTDQRAKNLFLTRWKDSDGIHRWYPYFYDNDTIFGINNEGALVFDYFHEDTDQLGSSNVYNGQNSVLWNNFRLCFPTEIARCYSELRSGEKLSYDKIINQYITQGSDKWSEAIYNADAEYKYVSVARGHIDHTDSEGNQVTGIDTSNLYQVRGNGEHHLKYFIDNRLNYCDSKWTAGDYPSNFFFLRIYTPSTEIPVDTPDSELTNYSEEQVRIYKSIRAIPPNPNITVTPFSAMYAGVRYKSGVIQQERLSANESHTFTPVNINETFGDTETAIYGASELASLGDLSGLYCGVVNLKGQNTDNTNSTQGIVKENKLTELIIGNPHPDYYNDNFREIEVGTCKLLKTIDLRNCAGLGIAGKKQKTLELVGCPNIENVYTEGTNLQSVSLPSGGYIKVLHLPKSINTIVVKNHKYITDFKVEDDDYSNVKILSIENSNLDTNAILEACKDTNGHFTVERVRLTGINWSFENADFVKSLFPVFDENGSIISGIRGIDSSNNNLDDAYLVGTCHISHIDGADYAEIKKHYPHLDITFDEMTSNVTFIYEDIDKVEHSVIVQVSAKNSEVCVCPEPVLDPPPAWEPNKAFTYELVGWSRRRQESKGLADSENDYKEYLQADALYNILGNRTLYPVFKAVRKCYDVTFINQTPTGNIILQVVSTPYGSEAIYTGETPVKTGTDSPELYKFSGWQPDTKNVTEAFSCYAQFSILNDIWHTIDLSEISDCVDANDKIFNGYTLNTANKTMSITECKSNFKENPAMRVPDTFVIEGVPYTVIALGGFSNHSNLKLIDMPKTLKEILSNAFYSCSKLIEVTIPENVESIGRTAFQKCGLLEEIHIPAAVTKIGDAAFAQCQNLKTITLDEFNTTFVILKDCILASNTNKLLQGFNLTAFDGYIPDTITSLGAYCFANTEITKIVIPSSISTIGNNAFSGCINLTEVVLPNSVTILDSTCFAWCSNLAKIDLPEKLEYIKTFAFRECALAKVTIPSSIKEISANAFGGMATLHEVTFEVQYDADGSIKVPTINKNAFIGSGGTEGIIFNVPWGEDYDYQYFETVPGTSDKVKIDPTGWGANNFTINYNYKGGVN